MDEDVIVNEESIGVADTIAAAISLAVTLGESVNVTHTAVATLNPLAASRTESLKVAHTAVAAMNLSKLLHEALRISAGVWIPVEIPAATVTVTGLAPTLSISAALSTANYTDYWVTGY